MLDMTDPIDVISTKRSAWSARLCRLACPRVLSTPLDMTVPIDVISTKRSAWRDPSTALGMTKGDVRDDKGDVRDDKG